jgi:alpha-1,3-rhamnosyl/mannosyltransferase
VLVGVEEPGYVAGVLRNAPGLAARVRWSGRVDDAALRGLYRDAAVFLFPSRYEGFGLPPLEAMGSGTAVVAADAASVPEVVGDAAVLVPPGDSVALAEAVAGLLAHPDRRAAYAAAGRERAAAFSWDRAAAETVRVYREASL